MFIRLENERKFKTNTTLPMSGQPTNITPQARRKIVQEVTKQPKVTSKQLKEVIAAQGGNTTYSKQRFTYVCHSNMWYWIIILNKYITKSNTFYPFAWSASLHLFFYIKFMQKCRKLRRFHKPSNTTVNYFGHKFTSILKDENKAKRKVKSKPESGMLEVLGLVEMLSIYPTS